MSFTTTPMSNTLAPQASSLTERVNFGMIRYANCWEDAERLLTGLHVAPHSRILSIASAGDNSLSLLTTAPKVVKAVDVSMVQLYLVELKRAAIRHLAYQDVLGLLGFRQHTSRMQLHLHVLPHLSKSGQEYWSTHRKLIEKGLVLQGKFERYLRFFARRILPFVHTRKRIDTLMLPKSAQAQAAFYDQHWNSRMWRGLFRLFFSRKVLGMFGRDPEFMREVEVSVGEFILDKAAVHLRSPYVFDNHFLHFMLRGNFGDMLPHYLQEQHFEQVRQHLDALELVHGYAHTLPSDTLPFAYFNLSNIFEYMDAATFQEVAMGLHQYATPQARLAYWNLMVPRSLSDEMPSYFIEGPDQKESQTADRGFFYQQFWVDQLM